MDSGPDRASLTAGHLAIDDYGNIVNAIVDAVGDLGVTHLEMPVTPERVWRATRRQV